MCAPQLTAAYRLVDQTSASTHFLAAGALSLGSARFPAEGPARASVYLARATAPAVYARDLCHLCNISSRRSRSRARSAGGRSRTRYPRSLCCLRARSACRGPECSPYSDRSTSSEGATSPLRPLLLDRRRSSGHGGGRPAIDARAPEGKVCGHLVRRHMLTWTSS
jgi:hypothetical protein